MPTDILGPLGALVGAIIVAVALWRAHLASDADVRAQRDKAMDGWRAQTTASDRMANALEVRNRRDATHTRAEDEP